MYDLMSFDKEEKLDIERVIEIMEDMTD